MLLLIGVTAMLACAQEEDSIRRVVAEYMQAVRLADSARVAAVCTPSAMRFSPGGTAGFPARDRLPSWKSRSNFVRRIEILNADTAVTIGVWKDFEAWPPLDAGTFHYTLIKQQNHWRIVLHHEAFLPTPQPVSSLLNASAAPDWEPLFDGKTTKGWLAAGAYGYWREPKLLGGDMDASWRVDQGSLVSMPKGPRVSIMTEREFLAFDLRFEWMAVANTNSGVKYRVYGFDRILGSSREALGFEYQIADDDGDPGAKVDPKQKSGALYALTPVAKSLTKPLGEWNDSRIVVTRDHVEHYLNGVLTARYEFDIPFASRIVLQHHTTEVRFRNIRIKAL
jgi:hypothetical protein